MTHSEQEEILRRALHAAADTIEPAPDGLERIRERLSRPRPLAVAWAIAAWASLVQAVQLRLEPAADGQSGRLGSWLRVVARSLEAAGERLRPAFEALLAAARALRPGSGMSRHEKLRSALAFGAAAVIGAAGGFALSAGLPQQVIQAALSSTPSTHHSGGSGQNPGSSNGSGNPLTTAPGTVPGGTRKASASPSPTCKQHTPTPSTSSLPTISPSTTSPSTSPSTSPATTPSTSPATTPPSSGSPSPTQSQSPGGVGPSTAPNQSSDDGTTGTPNPTPDTTASSSGATNRTDDWARPAANPSSTGPGSKHTSSSGPC